LGGSYARQTCLAVTERSWREVVSQTAEVFGLPILAAEATGTSVEAWGSRNRYGAGPMWGTSGDLL